MRELVGGVFYEGYYTQYLHQMTVFSSSFYNEQEGKAVMFLQISPSLFLGFFFRLKNEGWYKFANVINFCL